MSAGASRIGAGAWVLGFVVYFALSNFGGGLDLGERLKMSAPTAGLEGVGLYLGAAAAALIGVPLGAYLTARRGSFPHGGATALLSLLLTAPVTLLLMRIGGESLLTPLLVYPSWFIIPAACYMSLDRRASRGTDPESPQPADTTG